MVQTVESFPIDDVAAGASNIRRFRFTDNGQRRPSMQDAADAIMRETFNHPGVASQAMLPPQPSRAYSQGQRTTSIGQPLQLMDSNQSVPYGGKGKGRAGDFDPNQQEVFTGWNQTNMADPGQTSVPYVEDVQPSLQQPHRVNPEPFTFAQEELNSWQPPLPDYYIQSNSQQANFNPQGVDLQPAQPTQAHPHAHPHPVQEAGPAPPLFQTQQMTLPQALHHQHQHRQQGQQQPYMHAVPTTNAPPTNPQQQQVQQPPANTPSSFRFGVGYRFRRDLGFVCQACGTIMRVPGPRLIVVGYDHNYRGGRPSWRWCEAAGTELTEQLGFMGDLWREGWGRGGGGDD